LLHRCRCGSWPARWASVRPYAYVDANLTRWQRRRRRGIVVLFVCARLPRSSA
jgi:hypothetical protein